MTKEDEDLLRAVREWVPPKALHPIAMQAFEIYQRHGMKLPAAGVEEIRALLDAYGTKTEGFVKLAEAFEGLTRFTILLSDHIQDAAAGKAVVELMKTYAHLYEPFWQRVGEALQNVGAEQREAFNQFAGITEEKSAAAVGAPAPAGTIPLMALLPPARPPPWARKNEKK